MKKETLKKMFNDRLLVTMRQLCNYGLVVVALFSLFVNMKWGLVYNVGLSLLCLPYYAKTKMWDTVFFIAFMITVNSFGIIAGVPGCKP